MRYPDTEKGAPYLVKESTKRIARLVLGDYSIYRIYRISAADPGPRPADRDGLVFGSANREDLEQCAETCIQEQIGYFGDASRAYACKQGDRIVAICFFWYGDRYRQRNFWPLQPDEAKLVQIVTIPEMRGRGIARHLIEYATRDMYTRGFRRLYARIWHSNTPSIRVFANAGWRCIATVIEVFPLRRKRPMRMVLGGKH